MGAHMGPILFYYSNSILILILYYSTSLLF
jgi:hypothetical protein